MRAIALTREDYTLLFSVLAKAILSVGFVAVCGIGLWHFYLFENTMESQLNPMNWANVIYGGGAFLGFLLFIAPFAAFLGDAIDDFTGFWGRLGERWHIGGIAAWLACIASIPAAVMIAVAVIPVPLVTPPNMMRVMPDGALLPAGAVTRADPYHRTGKLMPVPAASMLHVTLVPKEGYETFVSYDVEVTLRPGPELEHILASNYEKLADNGVPDLVTDPVRSQLAMISGQITGDVRAGMLSGSPASLLMRAEQLLEMRGMYLPHWIEKVRVKYVTIGAFEKQN